MAGYVPGFQPQEADVVKLNTNENPYPPSPKVTEAIAQVTADSLRRYPPVYWDGFRAAASKVLGVKPERIVCGNGGDEILTILVRCCCDQEKPLAYPINTYSLYPILAQIQNCHAIEMPFAENGCLPNALLSSPAGLTVLCNPNAPTGSMIPADQVAKLAKSLTGVLLIDEAYVDFATSNCLELVEQFENVVILRSLSKGYSLAGLRFGFAIGSEKIVQAMCKVKDSYNVNAITQAAATAAIQDQPYFQTNVDKIITERTRLTQAIQDLGFTVTESQTNFILAQKNNAREIQQSLIKQKIHLRYFDRKGLQDKLRITVGTPDQNNKLLEALKNIA
jgi:histidinol-phosphate aminotransferase